MATTSAADGNLDGWVIARNWDGIGEELGWYWRGVDGNLKKTHVFMSELSFISTD